MNREKIHVIKTNYKILMNSQYHCSSVYIVLVKTGEENVNDVMREEKIFQILSLSARQRCHHNKEINFYIILFTITDCGHDS